MLYDSPVRRLLLATTLLLAVPTVVAASATEARADFSPAGRGRKAKPKPIRPPAHKSVDAPRGDAPPKASSADALVARYTAIVLSQPAAPFPIQRLAELARERDGNLKKIVEDFERRAQASSPEAWSAKLALAGLFKQDGRFADAISGYEAAIRERPSGASARLALAALEADRGDPRGARRNYEEALPLLTAPTDVESTRRALLGLCLDLEDWDAAAKHHAELVKSAQGSLFVKAELGKELMARGQFDRAETELREVVKSASGDNRALAPALRDLGRVLAKQKKMTEALATLKKALAVAGSAAGVRAEILIVLTDAFRAEGRLAELIAILESENASDFQHLAMLGELYEETGSVDKAVALYRRALKADPKRVDVRVRLVHLLQSAGDLEAAIAEYELLVRASPTNPDFVFELCETRIQRGDRPRALALLDDLERRSANDAETLSRLAEFYDKIEERERSLRVLQRMVAVNGSDPTPLIDLGDRYFQSGDKKRALETWARLRALPGGRAKAASALGDVYLDHDMPTEAIAALREAVELEPMNARFQKALAVGLERTAASSSNAKRQRSEAEAIWESLLASAANDPLLAREARSHVVSLWSIDRELTNHIAPLTRRLDTTPPDLEAGRLLAEVQRKLQRFAEAEATLRRVVKNAPGDEESLLSLERVLVQQRKLAQAIETLSKLVDVDSKRAREFYQRMAQYAAELYRDDDAITFAAKAVELSPDDAEGHAKLGAMYRKRQDTVRAISELRRAIQKNDRLFPVYFELAELLLATGQTDEADRLLRQVVRSAPDEELIARAARMSTQLNLGKDSLATLERELLPIAVGNPQKPVYRRLLVELYGAMTAPLVDDARSERHDAAARARAELAKIGARGVKPLLDALTDDRASQQRIAIDVLAYVDNKSAAPALYTFAMGSADKALRVRAMIACGALRDPSLLPRYRATLLPQGSGAAPAPPNDALTMAAAWGVARMGHPQAEPLLTTLLSSPAPDLRAVAALGLGLSGHRQHEAELTELARSKEAGESVRVAAIYALGELGGPSSDRARDLLVELASSARDGELEQSALVELARHGDDKLRPLVARLVAGALFSESASARNNAAEAALWLGGRTGSGATERLAVPERALSLRQMLESLKPTESDSSARARAVVHLAPALSDAAASAVAMSPARALVVASALYDAKDELCLAPLFPPLGPLAEPLASTSRAAVERVASAVVPGFVRLVRHPDAAVRARATELLARRGEHEAREAVIDALDDADEGVQRTALTSIRTVHSPELADAVAHVVLHAESWPVRMEAVGALGRIGARTTTAHALEALAAVARSDRFAVVRDAAARTLWQLDPKAARPLLEELRAKDAEASVRESAKALLGSP